MLVAERIYVNIYIIHLCMFVCVADTNLIEK